MLAGVLAALLSPDTREHKRHGRFDITGALTISVAVGSLVFAIIEGNETSWTHTSLSAPGRNNKRGPNPDSLPAQPTDIPAAQDDSSMAGVETQTQRSPV